MKFRELAERLLFGPLNNLAIGEKTVDTLSDEEIKRMVVLTDGVLDDLYTRFVIKERNVFVESLEWKSYYLLHSKHSFRSKNSEIKYIMDTEFDPFTDDVIRILGVKNEVGEDLPLNNNTEWASVFTPSNNVLQLTHPYTGQAFEVRYQAKHEKLVFKDKAQALELDIDLPLPLVEPLLIKVASNYYSSMSGQNVTNKSQELTMEYERLCDNASMFNYVGDSVITTDYKLKNRQFP